MNKTYKTAIIGGGASGLICAVYLIKSGFSGNDIVVLEKNDRIGKKIIATGNGQGNLSNTDLSLSHYYGDKNFISGFFDETFSLTDFFNGLGIPTFSDDEGRIYPLSRQASSFLDIIRFFLEKNDCNIITDFTAKEIIRTDFGYKVVGNGEISAKSVVCAFGGKAGKQFGTDGTSYSLLEKFGHKTTKLYPSLVQLKTEREKIRGLKGLKEIVRLTAIKDGKELKSVVGDLLFTDYGVSGDAVFKISSVVADKENCQLNIEFLPWLDEEQTAEILRNRRNKDYISDVYLGIINKRIGLAVSKGIKGGIESQVNALKHFTLTVQGTLGFDYAQVTKGGIKTDGFDCKTLESKKVSDLYCVGEALDIDGDCGGYNLTFAFLSGIKVAKAITDKLLQK